MIITMGHFTIPSKVIPAYEYYFYPISTFSWSNPPPPLKKNHRYMYWSSQFIYIFHIHFFHHMENVTQIKVLFTINLQSINCKYHFQYIQSKSTHVMLSVFITKNIDIEFTRFGYSFHIILSYSLFCFSGFMETYCIQNQLQQA